MSEQLKRKSGDSTDNDLKDRVFRLETWVASIRHTLEETQADIRALRSEFTTRFDKLQSEFTTRFDRLQSEFNARMDRQLYWLVGIIVTMILGFGGVLLKLASLSP